MAKAPTKKKAAPNRGGRPKGKTKGTTYTVKAGGKSMANTPFLQLAMTIAEQYFADQRSVTVFDNGARRSVAHYIYGHRQPKGPAE